MDISCWITIFHLGALHITENYNILYMLGLLSHIRVNWNNVIHPTDYECVCQVKWTLIEFTGWIFKHSRSIFTLQQIILSIVINLYEGMAKMFDSFSPHVDNFGQAADLTFKCCRFPPVLYILYNTILYIYVGVGDPVVKGTRSGHVDIRVWRFNSQQWPPVEAIGKLLTPHCLSA